MIAYHYPPYGGGSGIHRTLKFSRYLSEYGWQPIVLTCHPRAYPRRETTDRSIPPGVLTVRAFALDTSRHLSLRGAYPRWMALPDPWMTWWPAAVAMGARLIRKYQPDMIWSTYPIATAHMIGLALRRWSGLPWVADFRDPMVEKDPTTGEEFPRDPLIRNVRSWIESQTVKHCNRVVFTAHGTLGMYASRFPEKAADHWAVIPNGYDEEDFQAAEREAGKATLSADPILLVHSGVLYPFERDPSCFFQAVSDLRREGTISSSMLRIVLRATGHDDDYRGSLRALNIEDIVTLAPPVSQTTALAEMLRAHGLLIFQAANCNRQIPAKVYECLRAQRPIFAMTDPAGDTAALLRQEGVRSIVPLDSRQAIAQGLKDFLNNLLAGSIPVPPASERYSRQAGTRELAALLESICVKTS